MLNTALSQSSLPVLPPLLRKRPCPADRRGRRRGAQPGNLNARLHGFYAARHPHPAAQTLTQLKAAKLQALAVFDYPQRQSPLRSVALSLPKGTASAVWGSTACSTTSGVNSVLSLLQSLVSQTYAKALKVDAKTWRVDFALFMRAVHASASFKLRLFKLQQERLRLPSLAANAYLLYNWEFTDLRINEYPLFVPLSFGKNRANSLPFRPMSASSQPDMQPIRPSDYKTKTIGLTDDQWFLLNELLTTLREGQQFFKKYRRKSRFPDRLLLDAILWKLAVGARWQDLPSELPLRACQLLYKALCRSGRMAAIYTGLHNHLEEFGESTLESLVSQGCFQIVKNRVVLTPLPCLPREAGGEGPGVREKYPPLTWEKYTALLLLQRALFNQRQRKRQEDLDRRSQGFSYRLPPLEPLPSFRMPRSPSARPIYNPPFNLEGHPSLPYTSPDQFEPLESSMAYKKWRNHQKTERILRNKISAKTS
jgi:transposase